MKVKYRHHTPSGVPSRDKQVLIRSEVSQGALMRNDGVNSLERSRITQINGPSRQADAESTRVTRHDQAMYGSSWTNVLRR